MVSLVNKRGELGLEVPNSNISASKNSHRILVRQFLGLAGYYHRFVPGFVDQIISLIDLIRKEAPELVQWLQQCEGVVVQINKPLLHTPNLSLPFIQLQTEGWG